MSENAAGQLLGYSIQYPRALCHLLRASQGATVCIEVHGDVASIHGDGSVVAEEDKSSIRGNPIPDRSVDLWKTLSNWVNAVNDGELNPENTSFVLYRNQTGRLGIAERMDSAKSIEEGKQLLDAIKTELADIKEDHAIWPYYKNVTDNAEASAKIVAKFQLESSSGAGYDTVEKEVLSKLIPQSQTNLVITHLNGWLVREVSERISAAKPVRITWDEFHVQFCVLFDRARHLELIDFTLVSPPSDEAVKHELASRPIFLQQIELIEGTDAELIQAVTDYLRAQINRTRWIEDEIIDETIATDFEERLHRFWENSRKKIGLTNKQLSPSEHGQVVLSECLSRNEPIRGTNPPSSTIAGTYHELSNSLRLGWHLDWEALKNGGK